MTLPTIDPLGAAALVGGIGYAAGQFLSSRRRGRSDSLAFALEEVAAHKLKIESMEKAMVALEGEVHALRKENATLRDVITTRGGLDDKLIAALTTALDKQTDKLSLLFQGALLQKPQS